MKKLTTSLLSLGFLVFVSLGHAHAEVLPISEADYAIVTCDNSMPTGGGDAFPWSSVRTFPWSSIQGLWMASIDRSQDLYFSFRVTRTTNKIKQLSVEVYQANNCKKPLMRGVGYQSNYDKNIIRFNMNNYILKMGSFNSSDLDLNPATCGYWTLGANFQRLVNDNQSSKGYSTQTVKAQNVILKKVSSSTLVKCKNNY